MVTVKPLAWSSLASDAEMMPFPKEEVTPPVTKIYFVIVLVCYLMLRDTKIAIAALNAGHSSFLFLSDLQAVSLQPITHRKEILHNLMLTVCKLMFNFELTAC